MREFLSANTIIDSSIPSVIFNGRAAVDVPGPILPRESTWDVCPFCLPSQSIFDLDQERPQ